MHFFSKYSYIWKFDTDQEKDYNTFVRPSNLILLRLVSFLSIFGMSLFLIIDLFKEVDYTIVLATRIAVLTGATLIMWSSFRDISPRAIAIGVMTIVVLNFSASLITATFAGMPSYYITNLLFLIFVLVVTASGLHFRQSLMINTLCLGVFVAYSLIINQNPFYYSQYPHLFSIFVYIHIVGIVLESRRRSNFLQFKDLVEQKRLVEELNQQKNKVISILSHDVATPMTSLSKILYLQARGQITEEQLKPFMNGLSNEINNVSYLLNGLVRWSRSQMQGFVLNKSEVSLAEELKSKVDLFYWQALEKDIQIQVNVAPELHALADLEMARIIFRNLISNAIKFANYESVIKIEAKESGDGVEVYVTNEGKPIPSNLIDKLFTYQMPPAEDTKGERGTGLGLAMAAFFTRLNGGDIEYIPSSHGVTCFCVKLPVRKSKPVLT